MDEKAVTALKDEILGAFNELDKNTKGDRDNLRAKIAEFETNLRSVSGELKAATERDEAERKAREVLSGDVSKVKEVVEQLEVKLKRPGASPEGEKNEAKALETAHVTWMTKGAMPEEGKALVAEVDSTGGYVKLPPTNTGEIIRNLVEYAPIMEMANVIPSDAEEIEVTTSTGSPAVTTATETGARTTSTTPTFGLIKIPAHEYWAMPAATQKMLDTQAIDLPTWLNGLLAEAFADGFAGHCVTGTGLGQPFGFTLDASVAHVASGAAAAITLDGLVNMVTALRPAYRSQAEIAMNPNTLSTTYRLANGVSQPYLLPDLRQGEGLVFMGRRIREMNELPDEGAGTFPVYIADWKRFYYIVTGRQFYQTRDPYSSKPYVQFYTIWRAGGKVVKAEACKKLECAVA